MQIYDEIHTLFPELAQVKNKEWADITCKIWQEVLDRSEWKSLADIPFSIHMPRISLIEHTQAVLKYALKMDEVMQQMHLCEKQIDLDILIISCILHDVDKPLVTAPGKDGALRVTDIGFDYQHGFYSAYYAEKYGLPASIVTLLIDHTDYSRMAPDSLEGMILIMADLSDAELLKFSKTGTSQLLRNLGKESNRQKAGKLKKES